MIPHNTLYLRAFHLRCLMPRHKHNIPSPRAKRGKAPVRFADNPAAAVALDGATEFLSCCDTDTAKPRAVFQHIGNQRRICLSSAASIHTPKVAVLLKDHYFLQINQSVRPGLSFDLIREHFSAFCPAAGKNFAAASVGHSFAESVFHFPVALFRLVSPLHIHPNPRFKNASVFTAHSIIVTGRINSALRNIIIYQRSRLCQSLFSPLRSLLDILPRIISQLWRLFIEKG